MTYKDTHMSLLHHLNLSISAKLPAVPRRRLGGMLVTGVLVAATR
jgi:hypothetical protein